MPLDPIYLSIPTDKLCSRIGKLIPDLGLPDDGKDELASCLSDLQDKGERKQLDVYTVSTYLRRIFAKVARLESPAGAEARQEIKNYATEIGVEI